MNLQATFVIGTRERAIVAKQNTPEVKIALNAF